MRLCAFACAFAGWVTSSLAADAKRPNIIVILSDDMGFSDIGCYGGEIKTPNLDALAKGGVRFTQFYNTGRCCPTRASLLTGLYPHQAGIGWMMTDRGHPGYTGNLNNRCMTMAEVMKTAGYGTYGVGKWHVTRHVQPDGPKHNWPRQRGFDRFYGTITGAGSFFDPGTLVRGNKNISPFADPEYKPKTYYYTDAISDHAVRYIGEHSRKSPQEPFFMYVAYTAAHWPMHALPQDIARYKGKYDEGYKSVRRARFARMKKMGLVDPNWQLSPRHGNWDSVKHKAWEARNMEVYAAMIDNMDQGIGRIVAELKRTKRFDDTLILFMQDNGGCQEGVGRRGNFKRPVAASKKPIAKDAIRLDVIPKQDRAGVPTLTGPNIMPGPADTYIAYGQSWANASNTPFREYKHFVHEGGISTPLIAHWPKGISRRGAIDRQPGHLIDIMATCIDVGGVKYPAEYKKQKIQPPEGVSLVPAFSGKSLARSQPIFWEHEGNRAIRDGKWKLVAKENRPWELYDIAKDRTEMKNLAEEMPQRVKTLAAKWETWAKRANVLPLGTWRGKGNRNTKFNRKQLRFQLKNGDSLARAKAPYVIGRDFTVTVEVKQPGKGVLIAQGGDAHGWTFYLAEGKPVFATCVGGKVSKLECKEKITGPVTLKVSLSRDGKCVIRTGDDIEDAGKLTPLKSMPIDGLQVGRDDKGTVGEYETNNKFTGKLGAVSIAIQK